MRFAAWLALVAVYGLLPVVSIGVARSFGTAVRRTVIGGWVSGLVLGGAVLAAYAVGVGGRVPTSQALLTIYLGVGLMLFLKTIDAGLTALLRRAVGAKDKGTRRRGVVVGVLRLILFGGFALPWVMAAAMVYRPRVVTGDLMEEFYLKHDNVRFAAADGLSIAGAYYPSPDNTGVTALLCHGLGGNRTGFARMIAHLHDVGISVLAIDMRAHGESGGQLCSFGIYEKADALGAVAWLKAEHPGASERVVGVGASLGAAALLAAAVDEPRLDGVVVLSTYATMAEETEAVSRHQLVWPISWLVRHFGLPLASLHAGVDLRTARPMDDVKALWPRPVLIIHGTADDVIPFDQGRQIYDAAPIGRKSMWVRGGSHNGILNDDAVINRVIQFILSATPTPVV